MSVVLGLFLDLGMLPKSYFTNSRMENSRTTKDTVKQTFDTFRYRFLILFGTDLKSEKVPFWNPEMTEFSFYRAPKPCENLRRHPKAMILRISGAFLRWSSGRTEIAQTLCLCMFPRLRADYNWSRHRSELTPVHVSRRRPARHARNCHSKSGSKLTPVHGCAFEKVFRVDPPL